MILSCKVSEQAPKHKRMLSSCRHNAYGFIQEKSFKFVLNIDRCVHLYFKHDFHSTLEREKYSLQNFYKKISILFTTIKMIYGSLFIFRQVLQKLGKADETKDAAFEEGVINFNKQYVSRAACHISPLPHRQIKPVCRSGLENRVTSVLINAPQVFSPF